MNKFVIYYYDGETKEGIVKSREEFMRYFINGNEELIEEFDCMEIIHF